MSAIECGALMGSRPHVQIARQHCPTSILIERRDLCHVRGIDRKFVAQSHNLVLAFKQCIQRLRNARSKVVVEKQFQAASCFWNSTASRTALTGSS